jgi:branched-chain amino acid aminotransferase
VVYTTALQEGCIDGIMRRHIIKQLTAAGYKLVQGQVSIDDLEQADEVFLSNSIYNIRWVGRIGDQEYTCRQAQKIYAAVFSTKD